MSKRHANGPAIGLPLVILLALTGCFPKPPQAPPPRAIPEPTPLRVAGESVEGRPIEYEVLGDGERTVLYLAAIHGNEPAGVAVLRALGDRLRSDAGLLTTSRVVLVPVANPDGLKRRARTNARGVDLNRNFPAEHFRPTARNGPRPLSEPESRALHALLMEYRPDLVVTLHTPMNVVDYDGPAREFAQAMGRACRLPVRRIGARPGSLGSFVGVDRGVPIVTLEMPRDGDWERFGPALLAVLR